MTWITFYLFLVNLALGVVALQLFVPRAETGSGFHRFNSLLASALLLVAFGVRLVLPASDIEGYSRSALGTASVLAFLGATASYWLSLRTESDGAQRLLLGL